MTLGVRFHPAMKNQKLQKLKVFKLGQKDLYLEVVVEIIPCTRTLVKPGKKKKKKSWLIWDSWWNVDFWNMSTPEASWISRCLQEGCSLFTKCNLCQGVGSRMGMRTSCREGERCRSRTGVVITCSITSRSFVFFLAFVNDVNKIHNIHYMLWMFTV